MTKKYFYDDDPITGAIIESKLAERDRLVAELEELKQRRKAQRLKMEDVGIATLWDANDEHSVDKELQAVREHKVKPDNFEKKLYRYHNDQTVYFENSSDLFEPLESTEPKKDLVVNVGLAIICQYIAGKSTRYFTDYASGTGTTMEKPSDIRLASENARVSLITKGYVEPIGTSVKFTGKFDTFLPSATITEGGVFDSSVANAGNLLFRTVYTSGSRVQHIQNKTFYSLFQNIVLISVT